jgi:hypothetical protein
MITEQQNEQICTIINAIGLNDLGEKYSRARNELKQLSPELLERMAVSMTKLDVLTKLDNALLAWSKYHAEAK